MKLTCAGFRFIKFIGFYKGIYERKRRTVFGRRKKYS
jgi:hypothetical protein